MPRQIGLPAALARFGLRVELAAGWDTRGSATFTPRGAVAHWTAGPRGSTSRPSLNICINGRTGLPGPLCNVYLDRNGVAVVVAAGAANHAGAGGWKGLTGNSQVFGTEAECGGDGDWTAAQRAAYPRVNAAFCWLGKFGPDMVCGHSEWAPSRKIDIRDWPMSRMRAEVAALLTAPTATPARAEGFLMALTDQQQTDLYNKVMGRMSYVPHHRGDPDDLLGHVLSVRQNTEALVPGVPGKRNGGQVWTDIQAIRDAVTKPAAGPAVTVDAAAVAAALARDPAFVEAIAEGVAQNVAERLQS